MFKYLDQMRLSHQIIIIISVTMTVLMSVYLGWDLYIQQKQSLEELRVNTSILAKELDATRVYITSKQALINTDRDGVVIFKHLNSSVVLREISKIINGTMGYSFKLTRLKVRHPDNTPDQFEVEMLTKLSQNPKLTEAWGVDTVKGRKVFRYMLPLFFDEDCLSCHGKPVGALDIAGYPKEGASRGEFAGAISIIAPMDVVEKNIRKNFIRNSLSTLILLLTLTSVIYLTIHSRVVRPLEYMVKLTGQVGKGNLEINKTHLEGAYEMQMLFAEFRSMAENLKGLYNTLEDKVNERTKELVLANQTLQEHQETLQKINEELSRANGVKSEFIAIMSHELQTPLTAIIAYTEFILEKGSVDSQTTEYLYDIYESANHLLDLITDILNFSKIERNKLQLHPTIFGFSEIAAVVERIFHPIVLKNELVFEIEVPEDIPVIQADKNKVKQVLMNLLSNAVKFTPQGGKIQLKTVYQEEQEELLVSITDTGIGIREEDFETIFEKFSQINSGITRQYSGVGLGLAVTKRLVELHGGTIWVKSTIGQGTTFYFTLPIMQKPMDN